MNIKDFDDAVSEGLVSRKDRDSLSLYTYTPTCAFQQQWNPVTRAARGLVFDRKTGRVVARPFQKFFNLGEMPETQPEVLPATPMHVEEKIDGSLGIIFHHQGKWDVCTKGSFDSDQANYTREELLPKYLLEYVPTSLTLLCEIIYPENRIVIDYQERRELVLLTAFNSENGLESTRNILQQTANQIGMSLVREFSYSNILDLPFEENEEGYVVRFTGGLRVKIKSPDYVKVHRLLTYKSPKRMLELLQADQYDEIRRQIPEALVGDFDDLRASIKMSFLQVQNEAKQAFSEVQKFSSDRKTFALEVQSRFPKHMWSLMFGMLDGKNTDEMIFKIIKDTLKE